MPNDRGLDDLVLPLGFGMALAQNEAAMRGFEALSEEEKRTVLQRAHEVPSKEAMQQLVAGLDPRRQGENKTV